MGEFGTTLFWWAVCAVPVILIGGLVYGLVLLRRIAHRNKPSVSEPGRSVPGTTDA